MSGRWVVPEVRLAGRRLRHGWKANIAMVLLLACGMAGALAMYAVLDTAILQPLRYPHPEQLVEIWATGRWGTAFVDRILPGWRTLAAVQAVLPRGSQAAIAAPGVERVAVSGVSRSDYIARVTPQFFSVFGLRPRLGRVLLPRDYLPSSPRVAVLGERLWSQLGASTSLIGAPITLGRSMYVVVGVMPAALQWPNARTQLWIPNRERVGGTLVARLPSAASLADVQAGVAAAGRRVGEPWTDAGLRAAPLQDPTRFAPGYNTRRLSWWVLTLAAALLLTLTSANLVCLWILRGLSRRPWTVTQVVLGAGFSRLAFSILVECLGVSVCGSAAGVAGAWALLRLVRAVAPANLPRLAAAAITPATWVVCACLAVLIGFAFAGAPVLIAWRHAWAGRALTGAGSSWKRARGALLAVEIAIALALLATGALSLQTLAHLAGESPGFSSQGVVTCELYLPERSRSAAAQARSVAQVRAFLTRLRANPGVDAAAVAGTGPLGPFNGTSIKRGAGTAASGPPADASDVDNIGPGYFSAIRLPLHGRDFSPADVSRALVLSGERYPGGAVPVIVNQTFAHTFFGSAESIGQQIRTGWLRGPAVVVGIANDVAPAAVSATRPLVYLPWSGLGADLEVFVRSRLSTAEVAADLRHVAAGSPFELGPTVSLAAARRAALGGLRFRNLLLDCFAALAALVTVFGVYSFAALSSAERLPELAVRVACGATPSDIRSLVAAGIAPFLGVGLAAGGAGAWAGERLLASLLLPYSATNGVTALAVALALAAATFIAALVPAARAARADPAALLHEPSRSA